MSSRNQSHSASSALKKAVAIAIGAVVTLLAGMSLYALPAALTLPRGRRNGIRPLTLAEAADRLGSSYPAGAAQVEAARALVGDRMSYCRRNSFDHYSLAFSRGYGYCQQMSLALANLLNRMGYEAKVVHSLRVRFSNGRETSHAWVKVTVDGAEMELDPYFWDPVQSCLAFTPIRKVKDFTRLWRLLGGWGSPAVNAHRFYTTGRDL